MVSIEMKPILSLKMGSKTCQHTKGASEHLKKPRPKSFSKTYMKVELKETS
jgi:hypothetical protein